MGIQFFQGKTSLIDDLEEKSYSNSLSLIQDKLSELFNMKNIHFLFGSGTSSGAIPTMTDLFELVEDKFSSMGDKQLQEKNELTEIVARIDQKNLEEVLGILYSQRVYLNNKKNATKQLEVCNNVIETIEKVVFKEINVDLNSTKSAPVLETYKKFYRKVALRNKDLARVNIFTTNNDLFNEAALDSLNIHYINGFSGGLRKYFNPALFNYTFSKRMDTSIDKFEPVENMVNLYKIHGSVNWVEDNSNENTFFKIKEVSEPSNKFKNILIYPTPTKQNKSLGSPYVEMFREFQRKLMEPLSVLFVIGYSFSDEHVNNIIYQALATNSTMNLVIINDISDKPISKIEDDRIFKIWGETEEGEKLHYFNSIVEFLLPNVSAFKTTEKSLNEFLRVYNEKIRS